MNVICPLDPLSADSDDIGDLYTRECITFIPYCIFAMIGLSARKVKSLRFIVNGMGTMRPMKTTISKTRRKKTYTIQLLDIRLAYKRGRVAQ